ncbi:Glyoxalase/Bleomycin resistance protein/Dihydroxybiphenyl dioxygenase [Massarina eburnea CBS 473.64]|uniref:Glyoxalase/Bleomycin resistance protein/Dihydroxybiphenyl dioxygenase n=1 Tax=Massarina eburnea CBS 473.64 TaxID=1395130 RepID=A0A6A6RP37_9PLEO|nr:Glyoxalase/Bleomycin resistance protein/Dihydroxybiphenyl dioxygenase [Massarina eburnea CBS 473.64]
MRLALYKKLGLPISYVYINTASPTPTPLPTRLDRLRTFVLPTRPHFFTSTMRFFEFTTSIIPLVLGSLAAGCDGQTTSNATMTFGTDCSWIPGFEGYGISHFSLITNNQDRLINFYTKAFGMRLVFQFQPSPEFTTTYLGHNTAGYASCAAWATTASSQRGQIEILYLKGASATLAPSTQTPNSFGHIGVSTPDVSGTCNRIASLGGTIVKAPGAYITSLNGALGNAFGLNAARTKNLSAAQKAALIEGFKYAPAGISASCFATDPDGNLLEVQSASA